MSESRQDLLRGLPAIGKLLETPEVLGWLEEYPCALVTAALRQAVQLAREDIERGEQPGASLEDSVLRTAAELIRSGNRPSLQRVVNATGIVLHTGLGRAPLSRAALQAITQTAAGYSNLELDLQTGERGTRSAHVSRLLCALSGSEAATVTNNNAAATLLILNTIAGGPPLPDPGGRRRRRGAEVVVSRGQLIEIGGSYRLPDIMKASGVRLVEVGTTNRTRIADYAAAINDQTVGVLRVHTSNYRVCGFSEEVPISELVALGRERSVVVIDDLGSGAMVDLGVIGLREEPMVSGSIAAGADLVCFSGDKLLGGAQAGIILGSRRMVQAVEKNPLMRTYRVDKLTLAALEATLREYRDENRVWQQIPTLAMLGTPLAELERRAQQLAADISRRAPGVRVTTVQETSYAGGGSLPAQGLPTWAVCVACDDLPAHVLAHALRQATTPIVARVQKGALMLDVRTMSNDDALITAEALAGLLGH